MADELLASVGKYLTIELNNGKKISGTLLESNAQFIKLQVDSKVATIPYSAIAVIWDGGSRESLTEEKMNYVANQLRSEADQRVVCTSVPGFNCTSRYVCIPPDICTGTFACPGVYTPGEPQGGGCSYGIYQPCTFYFQQPCTYNFQQPCTYNFQQPCGFNFYQPCSFSYYQPCGFRYFFQPCGYRYNQPCTYNFQQPCGQPFGCNAPGGFTCPGQAFIGIAPGQSKKPGQKE